MMDTYQADVLLSDDQLELRAAAHNFAERELRDRSLLWEEAGVADDQEISQLLRKGGFLAMTMPPEYGGQGASFLDFIVVLEQIANASMPAASIMQATCSGPPFYVLELGSDELKAEVLPKIVADGATCAVAMTEADAGSDLSRMTTTIVEDGDSVVINGAKIYVGGGGEAAYYVTYGRQGARGTTKGLACAVVPRGTEGLEYGRQFKMLGVRTVPRQEVVFNNCRVPRRYLIAKSGEFRRMISTFNAERVHNACFNVAMAQGSYEHARGYAMSRETFGKRLIDHQGISWMFARMWTDLEAARWLLYRAALDVSDGRQTGLSAAMAKYYASEYGFRIVDQAMQIEGGSGIEDGYVQTAFRNVRSFRVAAGTSEMMLNYIGRVAGRPDNTAR